MSKIMPRFTDITQLLLAQPGSESALVAPGRSAMTHAALRANVELNAARLNELGICRNDRVALVLPNGPEMACAFLAVACAATAAPLNPAYRSDELEFYLGDLRAKAVIVERGSSSPVVSLAEKMGLAVLELSPTPPCAGAFELLARAGRAGVSAAEGSAALADDIALILHTSGTTSRPKIVPLTHRNVCASACNIRDTLELGASDIGLNIMPLFHIHGLIAGLLAPLSAGGSIFCSPGFNALKFFAWLRDARPTWYTAVPTMHQAIVARAAGNRSSIESTPLRFVRSSSSAMPPQLIRELEAAFGAPVIEAYGMTEAAHQMASNPLRGKRIPGSVGLAAGPEIAVMDAGGALLPNGSQGEIVIRGVNVMAAYENNPAANAAAFTQGWFRTGDQGVIDGEGYITLTGRLKEIINRGGEKISPREVDDVLMDHPAVAQVVTFGLPHDKLGEDVAAVVVLREGASVDAKTLRAFAAERLADFKVPRKILFVDEIPKGATGKPQRIGLAEKLGLA
jgi:acyl-CoA synthetase (AMP-forming)/AMP-acid ligase II